MEEKQVEVGEEEVAWSREIIPKVLRIVSTRLPQRDLIFLLLVSPWLNATLVSCPSIWLHLDFREMNNAGNRLVDALSLARYRHVKHINLEFAQDIEDKHLELVKSKVTFILCQDSLQDLEVMNLNGCQKISDKGIEAITSACPSLKEFLSYWNVRVTDIGLAHLVKNCKHIVDLNVSGCKNLSDKSLQLIAQNYPELQLLNLTRCVKLTDSGLQQILHGCPSLHSLNLYALSRCVRVTDVGVIAVAQACTFLEFLSLFGIVGVTDKCLEALSLTCSNTLTTLDVNGCIGIKKRSRDELLQMFPKLRCFKVHS
ncbi:hypothetical protein DVH24_019391 [Malus domestica]|uniref:F-box/LRR-repeat protein 15-like leucin rich repeat domain-containing protein n=1 Tax=Malus domestica TaxID=3750 RepID=A0A498I5X0_MALDO|nr:hypothetical protein DVH24_019391 [Malus domestica]